MTPRLSIAVMHAPWDEHRRRCVLDIKRAVAPWRDELARFEVVEDTARKGVWPTAERAWMSGLKAKGATHHLVLQDDAVLCEDFVPGVLRALSVKGDVPVSLYANRKGVEEAKERGVHWALLGDACYGIATVLPSATISPWLRWCAKHMRADYQHDDVRLLLYLLSTGQSLWFTCPSLVEHGGVHKSLLGHGNRVPQVARWFVGGSPLAIDWGKGADDPVRYGSISYESYRSRCLDGLR